VLLTARRPDAEHLASLRARAGDAPLSYAAVGASLRADLPSGWFRDACEDEVGRGPDAFAAACDALRGWRAHAGAGIVLATPLPVIAVGEVAAMALPVGPGWTTGACRIVAVVDDPDAYGFAYGSVAGHPERGEESLVVRLRPDGRVTFTVRAISRPGHALVWLVVPAARALQHRAARGFARGVRAAVTAALSAPDGG